MPKLSVIIDELLPSDYVNNSYYYLYNIRSYIINYIIIVQIVGNDVKFWQFSEHSNSLCQTILHILDTWKIFFFHAGIQKNWAALID